jgi:hypothetical protein
MFMRWIQEPNNTLPKLLDHVLTTGQGELPASAWVEYWTRILTDARGLPSASRVALAIQIRPRTLAADSMGQVSARFLDSLNQQADGIGSYVLRSEHFTFLQAQDEDCIAYSRRQLHWLLANYKALKAALRVAEVWPLYLTIKGSRPLPIRLATMNGWFDLQAGQGGFANLPREDQELLAGMDPGR